MVKMSLNGDKWYWNSYTYFCHTFSLPIILWSKPFLVLTWQNTLSERVHIL